MSDGEQGNVRWYLVFWLFVLSAVSFLDRVNIAVAGSSIAAEYRLSQIQLGWVFSAFLLGYALFQTPGGWLADRLGPRLVLTVGVLLWGIFTALTAAVSPAISATTLNPKSTPAVTPPAVIRLPSRTILAFWYCAPTSGKSSV